MVIDTDHAMRIVNKMAKESYSTVDKVLDEFIKYEKNGECQHFWPDENTACLMLIEQRVNK